jgi:predicted DsbA family dithiol-disulfide isomerase
LKKFGPRWLEVAERVRQQGEAVGIHFDLEGGTIRSTVNAHRLACLAYRQGGEPLQRRVMDLIFAGHFEHGQDIGCPTFLSHVAATADLFPGDVEAARTWVTGEELKAEVLRSAAKKREMGVGGVPFTVINGKYAICGAPEPEAFLEVFRKIVKGDLAGPQHIVARGPGCS